MNTVSDNELRSDVTGISDYRLLDYASSALNPSGLVLIEKEFNEAAGGVPTWRCPLTHTPVSDLGDVFASAESGLVYPVLRGILMLQAQYGIVAPKNLRLTGFYA